MYTDQAETRTRTRPPMNGGRGITDVFTELLREFTNLFRTEFLLARAEVSEKVGMLGGAIAMIAVGAVLLMAALVLILQAIVAALVEQGFTITTATSIVGGVVLILGALILWIGVRRLRPENLAPSRTVEQLQQDVAVARDQVRRS